MKLFLSLAILIIADLSAQDSAASVQEKFGIYHDNFPQEKVFIQQDKPHYVLGEKIWYKAYLLDAILHQPLTPSQQVIVELIDPDDNLVASENIWIVDGSGSGDFQLGPKWRTGKYLVRAYTSYQRNFEEPFFFEKQIRVYDAYAQLSNPDMTIDQLMAAGNQDASIVGDDATRTLMFFPEGGELVDGIATSVGVNAYDAYGEGVAVNGNVHSDNGDLVAQFNTHETGLGFFNFTPEYGQRYTARVIWDNEDLEFDAPDVSREGYVVRVREKRDTLMLTVSTSVDEGLNSGFIVAHMRGQVLFIIEDLSGSKVKMRVPLAGTPDGILHFTLFTGDGIPVSERLKFVHRAENFPQLELTLEKDVLGRREKVIVDIFSKDSVMLGSVNGSLTVTELKYATPHQFASDIRSYLLLESDLRGKISKPGFFFEDKPVSRKMLDLLMLTHGWKRFDWKAMLKDPTVDLDWMPENALTLKGYITKYEMPNKPIKSRVFISQLTDEFTMTELVSTENGEFMLAGLQGYDTIPLLIRAEIYKEAKKKKPGKEVKPRSGSKYVDIHIEPGTVPLVSRTFAGIDPDLNPDVIVDYFAASRRTQTVDSAYSDMLSVELDEVVIEAEKYDPVKEQHLNAMMYRRPDYRLVPDSMPGAASAINAFELIRNRIPGVVVTGSFPNYRAIIRQGTPYYVLDGMVVDVSLINSITADRVAFIDVLKGFAKTIPYGSGASGVIAFYTKTGEQMRASKKTIGTIRYNFPGYHKASVFYSPDYGNSQIMQEKPDYRTTLYWNSDVRSASNEKKQLTFYSGDKASVYSVRFQGVTSEGIPVVLWDTFEVR